MRSSRLAAVLALALLASCVPGLRPTLPPDFSPDGESGYVGLLGRAYDPGPYIYGLVLQNEHGFPFTVPLRSELALANLPAGTYHAVYFTVWRKAGDPLTSSEIPVDHPVARPFVLDAGEVVILGSWDMHLTVKNDRQRTTQYSLSSRPLTAIEAATSVRGRYPVLADARVRCLLCQGVASDQTGLKGEPAGTRSGWADPRLPGRRVKILGGGPAQGNGPNAPSHDQRSPRTTD